MVFFSNSSKFIFQFVICFDSVLIYMFVHDFSVARQNIMKFKLLPCFFKGLHSHLCKSFCYADLLLPLIPEPFIKYVIWKKLRFHRDTKIGITLKKNLPVALNKTFVNEKEEMFKHILLREKNVIILQ